MGSWSIASVKAEIEALTSKFAYGLHGFWWSIYLSHAVRHLCLIEQPSMIEQLEPRSSVSRKKLPFEFSKLTPLVIGSYASIYIKRGRCSFGLEDRRLTAIGEGLPSQHLAWSSTS